MRNPKARLLKLEQQLDEMDNSQRSVIRLPGMFKDLEKWAVYAARVEAVRKPLWLAENKVTEPEVEPDFLYN